MTEEVFSPYAGSLKNKAVLNSILDTQSMTEIEGDKILQEIFDSPDINLRVYLNGVSRGILVSLITLARRQETPDEPKFYASRRNVSHFIDALEEARIPNAKLVDEIKNGPQKGLRQHFVLASWHDKRAKKAFLEYPETNLLQTNPVEVITGEDFTIPTTFDLKDGQRVARVSDILNKLGIDKSHYSTYIRVKDAIRQNYDLPIVSSRGAFYAPIEYQAQLSAFVENFLGIHA